MEVSDDSAYQYLVRELDRQFYPSCFPLFLRSRYRGQRRKERFPVPRFTRGRLDAVLKWVGYEKEAYWALSLLQVYMERSPSWREGVSDAASELATQERRAVNLLLPHARPSDRRRYVLSALKAPGRVDHIRRSVVKLLGESDTTLPEHAVLNALEMHGLSAIELLEGWFSYGKSAKFEITAKQMNEWIDLLARCLPRERWTTEVAVSNLFGPLARAWSVDGRAALLRRAEDQTDEHSDFILSAFVLKLSGFSIAELSEDAAARLLQLYLDGDIEPYPSPGEVATDAFIDRIVLPRAASISEEERDMFDLLLSDAGGALGRRFTLTV